MISRSFLKSSFIYTLVGALPLASGFFLLPFYANLLSSELFGQLAIYTSFSLLVQIIVNMGLDTYLGIHFYDHKANENSLARLVGTVFTLLLLIGLAAILLFFLTGDMLFSAVFIKGNISFFPYGFLSVITAVFNSFFKTYTFFLIYRQEPLRFLWLNLFNFFITLFLSISGLYLFPDSLIGPVWAKVLCSASVFILAIVLWVKEYGVKYNRELIGGMKKFSFPLVIFGGMMWITGYFNNYIIQYYFTNTDVGIYSLAYTAAIIIDFTQNGLANAINPVIYEMWKKNASASSLKEENTYHHLFTLGTVLVVAALVFLLPLLLPLIIKNEALKKGIEIIPYLCVPYLFRGMYNMYSNPVYFFKKTNILPSVFFIGAVIQIGGGIILIRYFGIAGAISINIIVKIIHAFIMRQLAGKLFSFSYNKWKMLGMPVAYGTLIIVLYSFFGKTTNYTLIGAAQFIFAVLLILLIFKNEIPVFRNFIMNLFRRGQYRA